MDILSYLPNPIPFFSGMWTVFSRGGFVIVILLVIFLLYLRYIDEIQSQWLAKKRWKFLLIRSPKENLTSMLSVEQIFAQLHMLYSTPTFAEKYVEGKVQLWYSWELVSFGGKLSYVIRCVDFIKTTVESAIYAQYPDAEITEIDDYMENIVFKPDDSSFDVFGAEITLAQNQAFPIRTYQKFEHAISEAKIIDPLFGLLEAMSKLGPEEFLGYQLLTRPIMDKDWKGESEKLVKEFMGEKAKKKDTTLTDIQEAIQNYNIFRLLASSGDEKKDEADPWKYFKMTKFEMDRLNEIQRKTSKPGYQCKIRLLYIAPKEKMQSKVRFLSVAGAFRVFGDAQSNSFKPAPGTSTKVDYRFSPGLEEPLLAYKARKNKIKLFEGFKARSMWLGAAPVILNTEELATIFHFPLTNTGVYAAVEKVESKKGQAPNDLPVSESFEW